MNEATLEKMDMMERAVMLVEEAMELVDNVMDDHPLRDNYEAYGKYGFNTLLGHGNPYDDGLQSIVDSLEED